MDFTALAEMFDLPRLVRPIPPPSFVEWQESTEFERLVANLPFVFDWCSYKGEVLVARVNYEATLKARRPMVDLYHCMTTALNEQVLRTVQYDKSKFAACHLTEMEWKSHE